MLRSRERRGEQCGSGGVGCRAPGRGTDAVSESEDHGSREIGAELQWLDSDYVYDLSLNTDYAL